MTQGQKVYHQFSIFCAVLVAAGGLLVIAGWIAHVDFLVRVFPGFVSMQASTAITFMLSGITIYLIAESLEEKREMAQLFLPLTTLLILLLMTTLLVSVIFRIQTGIENFLFVEDIQSVPGLYPSHPSVVTIVDFILVAFAGILVLFQSKQTKMFLRIVGSILCFTGVLAVMGYGFQQPLLYFYHLHWSNGMALHTALLFFIIGVSFVVMGKEHSNYELSK